MFELSGSVKEIFEEKTFGSGFNKREFVITTEDKYPQDIKFELVKDKTTLLESVKQGEKVTVSFDVRGREWNGNYYVNLNAWKIDRVSESEGDDAPFDPADAIASEPAIEEEPPF